MHLVDRVEDNSMNRLADFVDWEAFSSPLFWGIQRLIVWRAKFCFKSEQMYLSVSVFYANNQRENGLLKSKHWNKLFTKH